MATDQERADLADSLVNLAQGAMRAAMLINGAGAVAVLAFVGQAWPEKLGPGALASAKCAIVVFTLGVGVAAVSTLSAYFTQLYYYRASKKVSDDKVERKKAEVIRHFTILFIIMSFIIFGIGVFQSLEMFQNHAIPVERAGAQPSSASVSPDNAAAFATSIPPPTID